MPGSVLFVLTNFLILIACSVHRPILSMMIGLVFIRMGAKKYTHQGRGNNGNVVRMSGWLSSPFSATESRFQEDCFDIV